MSAFINPLSPPPVDAHRATALDAEFAALAFTNMLPLVPRTGSNSFAAMVAELGSVCATGTGVALHTVPFSPARSIQFEQGVTEARVVLPQRIVAEVAGWRVDARPKRGMSAEYKRNHFALLLTNTEAVTGDGARVIEALAQLAHYPTGLEGEQVIMRESRAQFDPIGVQMWTDPAGSLRALATMRLAMSMPGQYPVATILPEVLEAIGAAGRRQARRHADVRCQVSLWDSSGTLWAEFQAGAMRAWS